MAEMAKFKVKYLDGYDKEKTMTVDAPSQGEATKQAMQEKDVCLILETARCA